jgi:hypothetical protein
MADLNFIEKSKFEKLFSMNSGYVLDFSDRTFREFVSEAIGLDIYDEKYKYASGSKANRLRAFIKVESNYVVGKLLGGLLDYWLSKAQDGQIDFYSEEDLYKECCIISERLKQDTVIEHIDVIQATSNDKDFNLLAKSIRESIEKNEPEGALDRLHTFTIKFIRELCGKHKISYDKDDSLNSIFGKYVKHLTTNKIIDSMMAERILRFSIHVLEAFNDIRNNKSFAHDNPVLNYSESVLIFNNVNNTIKFIQNIEGKNQTNTSNEPSQSDWDNLPF